MKIEHIGINDIIPYEKNAKLHPPEQIEQIKNSIIEFGFNDPIAIDENNVIIEGHGRLQAIKELGYKQVECIRLSHMSEAQKKAYIIAHNKLTLNTGFDISILKNELEFLTNKIDLDVTGFDSDELKDILEINEENIYEDDYDVTPPKIAKSQTNDIWILGNHKLICGDSTKQETYTKLIEDESIDLVVTDPPYNVDYGSKAEAINKYGYKFSDRHIENDYMPEVQFIDFLTNAFENMKKTMKNGAAFYIFHASITLFEFEQALRNNNMKSRQQIIWNKNSIVLGRQDYQWKHEPCLYGWKDGAGHYFINERNHTSVYDDEEVDYKKLKKEDLIKIIRNMNFEYTNTSVLDFDKPSKSVEHPTMKPVKLIGKFVRNSSKSGQNVLDNFAGSGSTLIACEQLGRKSYNIELDPKFVDVIVNRYRNINPTSEIKLIRNQETYTYDDIFGGNE